VKAPGKGNDKGKVEGLVKYARANFMTPIPVAASFEAFNALLSERCRARQSEHAARHAETIGARLAADIATMRELPAVPLEPYEKRVARVSSTALVRYRGNDYLTPTAYGVQEAMVKGFVEEVVILCRGEEIAQHGRCYGQGVFVYDSLHYLALLEMKPNALHQAAAVSEVNRFIWPGPDLRAVSRDEPERFEYGLLPPSLFRQIRERFMAAAAAQRVSIVPRDE